MADLKNGCISVVADCDDTIVNTTRDLRDDIWRVEKHLTPVIGVQRFFEEYPEGNWCISRIKGLEVHQVQKLTKFDLLKYFVPHRLQLCPTDADKKAKLEWIATQIDGGKVYVEDRLDFLEVGKQCGFITIRMRLRKGKYSKWEPRNRDQVPDYTVRNWYEIKQLPIFAGALRV